MHMTTNLRRVQLALQRGDASLGVANLRLLQINVMLALFEHCLQLGRMSLHRLRPFPRLLPAITLLAQLISQLLTRRHGLRKVVFKFGIDVVVLPALRLHVVQLPLLLI